MSGSLILDNFPQHNTPVKKHRTRNFLLSFRDYFNELKLFYLYFTKHRQENSNASNTYK